MFWENILFLVKKTQKTQETLYSKEINILIDFKWGEIVLWHTTLT